MAAMQTLCLPGESKNFYAEYVREFEKRKNAALKQSKPTMTIGSTTVQIPVVSIPATSSAAQI